MRVVITFDMSNSAFEDNPAGELEDVMDQAREKIRVQMTRPKATVCDAPEEADLLRDSNGNTIGAVSVIGERKENDMSKFAYELKDQVKLVESGEIGTVVGRAEYTAEQNHYSVRYKNATGRQIKCWWAEEDLEKA